MSPRVSLVASNSNWNIVIWSVKLLELYLTVQNKVFYYFQSFITNVHKTAIVNK